MTPVVIGGATLHRGDCIEVMRGMPDASVDSIVCDPPYELGFMGKGWDSTGIANSVKMWREALRVLKPGGHLLAFSGSRTYHRMTCAIEDAGFDVRDQIMWIYGSGFPKSLDVGRAIDKTAGAEREVIAAGKRSASRPAVSDQSGGRAYRLNDDATLTAPATDAAKEWDGWGTALKPAHEPICVARKALVGTVAENVLQHGTGAINIADCRINTGDELRVGSGGIPCRHDTEVPRGRAGQDSAAARYSDVGGTDFAMSPGPRGGDPLGRWPANIIHDGSDEVVALFPCTSSHDSNDRGGLRSSAIETAVNFKHSPMGSLPIGRGDSGNAARFFYCAKASAKDRNEGLEDFAQIQAGIGDERPCGSSWERRAPEKNPNAPRANIHPTVKPTDLMAYLCRLVTPPGGTVLDPFMGSGSTGKAAMREGFKFIGIDMTPEYVDIATARISHEIERVANAAAEAQASAELAARQPDLFAPMKQEQATMFAELP